MMGLQSYVKEVAPFAAMIFIEAGEVGMTTLTKAAMNNGMSNFVYVVYYNALGVLILFPYFLFQKHRNKPPPLTLALLWRFFLLGLLGKSLVMFGYVGIDYSSPTLAAALGNLTPVFTFLLAIIFRMEKIEIRSPNTGAKAVGTVVAVAGALIVTLYRGPAIAFATSLYNHSNQWKLGGSSYSNWMLGGLYLAIGYVFGAAWSIAQAATVKEYPEQATVIFYYCLFGTMQCAVVSLLIERNPSTWILSPGIGIAAIVYSAIFGTAIRYCVITWCLNEKGPLFVSLFKPLGMIVSLVGGIIFLGDALYLGSVVGAIVIALGFYTVMWGQAKEDIIVPNVCVLESSTETTPLLLGTRDV